MPAAQAPGAAGLGVSLRLLNFMVYLRVLRGYLRVLLNTPRFLVRYEGAASAIFTCTCALKTCRGTGACEGVACEQGALDSFPCSLVGTDCLCVLRKCLDLQG